MKIGNLYCVVSIVGDDVGDGCFVVFFVFADCLDVEWAKGAQEIFVSFAFDEAVVLAVVVVAAEAEGVVVVWLVNDVWSDDHVVGVTSS
jgi:hypothetical protein